MYRFDAAKRYWLQFQFFEHVTRFPLESTLSAETTDLTINRLRVHYFFSVGYDLYLMLKHTFINIRITDGDSWDHPVLTGKSLCLQDFLSNPDRVKTIVTEKCVYLFSEDFTQQATLHVHRMIAQPVDNHRTDGRRRAGSLNV